jgi:Ion channel
LLLIILIASYLLSAFFSNKWISDAQLALFTFAGFLAIRSVRMRRRTVRLIVPAVFVISVLMIIIGIHQGGSIGRGIALAWTGVLLLFIVVVIVRQVLAQSEVTVQSIYGAISAYLIIGLMFAAFYGATYYLHNKQFFANDQAGTISNFQYFSFTTLTTLGYGDFTAADSGGRAVAMLEAMTGQIFLSVLVAKLVSSFRPSAAAARGAAGAAAGDDD